MPEKDIPICPFPGTKSAKTPFSFSREWAGAKSETAEKQTFWNDFFEVFGIRRRIVASFEEPVKKISGQYGYIDLFWPGMLLVEHKSFGKDLGKAESQAFQYIRDLLREGREADIPRYVIVSDFARFALHDLEPEEQKKLPLFDQYRVESIEFPLDELHKNIHQFAFIAGYQQHKFEDQDPINIQAVGYMDALHDALEDGGYSGHELERFLVRILFCLFAEDTGFSSAMHLDSISRIEPSRMEAIWDRNCRICSRCLTLRRRNGRRISMKRWPPFLM